MRDNHCTINIHTGKKLSGKSREEILEAIVKIYGEKFEIIAVQQNFDMIRVTFGSETQAVDALKEKGIRLFGIWCRILMKRMVISFLSFSGLMVWLRMYGVRDIYLT